MTDQSQSINRFLDQLSSQGRFFETSAFTIDTLKAREKLSQFQLADSGLWLVKIVQAAVAGAATSIKIQFGKRRVKIAFQNTCDLKADDLLQHILAGNLPAETLLMHLVTGLRASAASVNEKVAWSCGGACVVLDSGGSSVSPAEASDLLVIEATRPSRIRSLKKTLASSIFHLAKQTVEEYDAIKSRCWASPIPIFLDGKELERGYHIVDAGKVEKSPFEVVMKHEKSRNQGVVACIGLGPLPLKQGCPELAYPLLEPDEKGSKLKAVSSGPNPFCRIYKPFFKHGVFLQEESERKTAGGVVSIIGNYKPKSSIDFLLDGALVKRFNLEKIETPVQKVFGVNLAVKHGMSVRYAVPVEADQLDLSQFNIREPNIDARVQEMFPALERLADVILENSKDFFYLPMAKKYGAIAGIGLGAQLTATMALSKGLLLVPFVGMVGAVAAINTAVYRSSVRKQMTELLRKIEEAYLNDRAS